MPQFNLPELEKEQLKKWDERDIFKQVLAKKSTRGNFVFFEGPPTANGKPGLHHLLTRAFKDIIIRFRTMQGYHVDRKAGWDTHGLPVELQVEKALGFTKKQDIENYGVAAFNKKCRESVWEYVHQWEDVTKRIAFWVDMTDPYITYKNDYIESLWWILGEIHKKSLLYKGHRVTPHCPRCVTSLSSHELAQGYKDVKDPSVYVKFKLVGESKYFLVWTTTPWTLPANVALAVGPDVVYSEVKMINGEVFILAKDRLLVLTAELDSTTREFLGSELVGKSFEPLYQTLLENDVNKNNAYKVYAADFVTTTDGTGIVHIAPAFGEDDGTLGKAESLPTLVTVDPTGKITAEVPGVGKFFKTADKDLSEDLQARQLLFKEEKVLHAYPFCWRCDTPILYYAKSTWYIRMSELRERLMANNNQINWVPNHLRDGRFGEWLREVKDWALSRERYWGTPLPIWECSKCDERTLVSSLADLERHSRVQNKYFLLRHGEADSNVGAFISSFPETRKVNLTEKGEQQIKAATARLKSENIDLIFTSDLLRTQETAKIVSLALGVEVKVDKRLRELNVGEFNGCSESEFHKNFNSELERFDRAPKDGETMRQARIRMVELVKELQQKYSGRNILIVSHGDPIWMLETGLAGLSDEESLKAALGQHGEVRELKLKNLPYDEQGRIDFHRPFIDQVILKCSVCGADMKRIPDLCDVWFDSGAMPFAQWHYPFENSKRVEGRQNFPADYISEAIDQTRGWFYTLLAVSTLLGYDQPPFKNVICLGHVLDVKGQKMSKSKGNVVDPFVAINTLGADAIRFYFYAINQPGEYKRFDERAVTDLSRKVFGTLWNVWLFYSLYARVAAPKTPPNSTVPLDQWLLSQLARLVQLVSTGLENYDVVSTSREIINFVNLLSTWYLRRSRDRFKSNDGDDKAAAVATLGFTLRTLSLLLAPFAPFFADQLYELLGGNLASVHLEDWMKTTDFVVNENLHHEMDLVMSAASLGLETRATAIIPVRQVLARAWITSKPAWQPWMKQLLAEELNVEEVLVDPGESLVVELDKNLTPDLLMKGAARELVRQINDLRKAQKLTINDLVKVTYQTASDFWQGVLANHGKLIMNGTLATSLDAAEVVRGKEVVVNNEKIILSIV